jgi:hypothetical protein
MKQRPILKAFVCPAQAFCIRSAMQGEEGDYFRAKVHELQTVVDSMPVTYETEGSDEPRIAQLHYFGGCVDAWIAELDKGSPNDPPEAYQSQAWGKIDLGCGPELGYISIPDLLRQGLELDLHWKPKPLSDCGEPEPGPTPEPYQLDPTPPAPDPEAERRARKEALAEQAGRRLFGRSVDTTGDLFDQNRAPAPLFAAPTPRAAVIA